MLAGALAAVGIGSKVKPPQSHRTYLVGTEAIFFTDPVSYRVKFSAGPPPRCGERIRVIDAKECVIGQYADYWPPPKKAQPNTPDEL
jgi:hypothetical protein